MYLAIDIGGTKTLIALFSKRGRVLRKVKFKTARGCAKFLNDLTRNLQPFTKYKVSSITVAIPGIVQKNCSIFLGNRPEWGFFSVSDCIKNLFNCPIYLENDASLGAFYEGHFCRGKVVFLTFSTGIGGGIVEHGFILPESATFEPGHISYIYNNKTLEWEDIASAQAIEHAYHFDPATSLRGRKIMQDIAARISLGLPDIIEKYCPDTIILGGPLGKLFPHFVKYLPKSLRASRVRFKKPKRPLESVIYGCYLYCKSKDSASK